MLDICLLGCGGMQPLPRRRLSALLVRLGGALTLIDCGEGTQVAVRECGWGLRHIDTILLTHMHADHVLGLPGLLLTLAHAGKDASDPLTIYGPEPLLEVLRGLLVVAPRMPYPIKVEVLAGGERFQPPAVGGLSIACAAMAHDIPCLAYALEVPRTPRFDPARARALGIPVALWRRLQAGETVLHDGRAYQPAEVLGPPRRGVRVVYGTDTALTPVLTQFVAGGGAGADLLIADAMYPSEVDRPKRWESLHLTYAEAATLARDGGARRLWLTHFGPAIADPAAHLERAQAIFPHTMVGFDGMTETLTFSDDAA